MAVAAAARSDGAVDRQPERRALVGRMMQEQRRLDQSSAVYARSGLPRRLRLLAMTKIFTAPAIRAPVPRYATASRRWGSGSFAPGRRCCGTVDRKSVV